MTNISFQGFSDICTPAEIAAAESNARSPRFPSLTCGEVKEIIDLLVQTRDFYGNQVTALQEWITDNDRKVSPKERSSLLLCAQAAWVDFCLDAAAAANA